MNKYAITSMLALLVFTVFIGNAHAIGTGFGRARLESVDFDDKEVDFEISFAYINDTLGSDPTNSTCYLGELKHEDYEDLVEQIDEIIYEIMMSGDMEILYDYAEDEMDFDEADVESCELETISEEFDMYIFDFGERTFKEGYNYAEFSVLLNNSNDEILGLESFIIGSDEIDELVDEDTKIVTKSEKIDETYVDLEDFLRHYGFYLFLILAGLISSIAIFKTRRV